MKHSQEEINKIWSDVKGGKYENSSAWYQPIICSDDDTEQCISIPNIEGSAREVYSRKNKDDKWGVVPYVGEEKL
ncbi:hypothetical protein [Kushneria marisflavi]|uniref:hypothetical protein n=1 Tax=Kushneria marisflavi TaxID=157779 RepID=UPI0011C34E31|nr:hypothetical protein [Kushneria marisflavi]